MDNELLIQLLGTHNRLIIPLLGAFLKKDLSGNMTIVFTPFLKKDDGVLTKAISEYFSTSDEESEAMISEFVAQINHALENNAGYELSGIGTLKRDVNGAVTLINEPVLTKTVHRELPRESQPKRMDDNAEPTVVPSVFSDNRAYQPTVAAPAVRPQPQPTVPVAAQQQQPVSQPIPVVPPAPRPVIPGRIPNSSPAVKAPAPQPRFPVGGTPVGQQRPVSSVTGQRPTSPAPVRTQQPGASGSGQNSPQQRRPQPRPQQRPAPKRNQPKADIWLIVAIIAALIVIALIIYGYLNTDPMIDLHPVVDDAAAAVDTLTQ